MTRSRRLRAATCALLLTQALAAQGADARFRLAGEAPASRRVELVAGERVVLHSPPEGLWSVALGFAGERPTAWRHAGPDVVERVGAWTVLTGALTLPEGALEFRDAYRDEGGGVVRGRRRFRWTGAARLDPCTLSLRFIVPGGDAARPFLPGVSTFGNPSGAKHGGRVAIQTGAPGEESFYEEHRFPMPFACVEGEGVVGALHVLPSLAPGGRRPDLWWSLGLVAGRGAAELASRSGPVASNGGFGVVKARQEGFAPYPDAASSLAPGAIVEKEFALEAGALATPATGFVRCVDTALRRAAPYATDGLPTADEIVRAKIAFARSRFRELPNAVGFEMYPDSVRGTRFVMGWCGQAEALGYAFPVLEARFGPPGLARQGERALDFLATAPVDDRGFRVEYDAETRAWSGGDPVSEGQALESFTRAIESGRRRGAAVAGWERFVVAACDAHARRLADPRRRPVSTAEAFLVAPLLRAARLFGREDYAATALRLAEDYAVRHGGFAEPYWGGTLDATCEDKEGAWAALQAFLAAYDRTGDAAWLPRLRHALAQTLAYTCVYDLDPPPGRLRDRGFRTRGWTVVSAQNQHLDVYGVYYTPEIWRLGEILGRPELRRLARVMFRSCGQLLDEHGAQGEQIQHTNFAQAGDLSDPTRFRGGYAEGWTVFWITTHFLHAAARFAEMGVDLDEE